MGRRPKEKKVEEVEIDKPVEIMEDNQELKEPVLEEEVKTVRVITDPITVVLPNGVRRVYSRSTHGNVFSVLAKNFADSNNGTFL